MTGDTVLHALLTACQLVALPLLSGAVVALWPLRRRGRALEARLDAMRAVQTELLGIRLVAEDIVDQGALRDQHLATFRMLLDRTVRKERALLDDTLRR